MKRDRYGIYVSPGAVLLRSGSETDRFLLAHGTPIPLRKADGTHVRAVRFILPIQSATEHHGYFVRRGYVTMLRTIDAERLAVVVVP